MPRIFKGTETLLKLFVPRVDEGNLETLKIGLFTDDTNNAAEFYGDNMSIDGDTVYLKVNAWSFDMMNDGVLNYIAEIEIGEETIITERQSNYFLKTPNQYVPVGPDLSDYYTKPEIDEMLEDIEVDVDLTGYATEQWVEDKTYATEQYVNDAIANIDIPEGGDSKIITYQMGTDWSLEEAYNNFHNGYMIHLINSDGRIGIVTDSSNDGMIRLNGFLGDLKGDAKPLRFECNNNQYLATWKLAFNEDIIRIDRILNNGGSGGESVIVELTGSRPTLDEYNTLNESAIAGKPTYVKYKGGIFNVIALNNTKEVSMNNSLFHIYIENTKIYFVWWYTSNFSTGVVESKSVVAGFDGTIDKYECNSNDIKINSISGTLPSYLMTYGGQDMAPLSFIKDKSATMIQDGKLYYFDFVNGEKDGLYTKPQVIDLLNIQGGGSSEGGSDECIIIYEPNEETYTDEEKAHNGEMIKKIHNGTVKTAYLRYRNHTYDDAYIYVPLAFGWEVAGDYGYMTGVCKYWYYGSLHYDYFAIDMGENGEALKFEVEPMETGSGGSGDADLSNYYTKEETDNLIANSSVMLEATDDGVLTYSQINGIRDNWTNAYVKVHLRENLIPVDKYVAVTSLYINDALADNKNIHLEGICEGYLYTWDIKGSNREGTLVRTPISAGGAAKAVVVETEKQSNNAYTDILVYSKLAIIQENIGNVYIRGKLNQNSADTNDAVVTNIAYHPLFNMLGMGDCKVTAMNANNIYTWTFTNKTTQASPTITPISSGDADLSNYYTKEEVDELISNSGGGSTPSTETDSGVYVLDYVSEYQVMYEENNWDSVTNHVYADSERQEHNAEVYRAWKEGKVKALYYKHVENTFVNYGETLQYQLVPCSVKELIFEENGTEYKCMGVNSLYRQNNQYDPTDIQSTMFSLNEDGSLRGEYAESFQVVYEEIHICDAYYYDGEGFRLDNYVPINYIGGGWRSCEVELVYETTRERVSLNYIIKDFWTENNSTVTLYGTLSNGSIIKWDFLANNGNIIDEYAYAQIIPMEADLSSYYTKEEVDELIANINLGDGATIESIVANEVANQLTDNFKTINGESILGEGDITIQGGGDADLSNYYTKEEVDELISNSGGGSGNIGELFYPTITSPTIVGEMTFNDEQLPHVDISESVYCNFKARKTQSKDLWVNNIHIGTNTDTVKIASPYYESTENMPDGEQEVYAEFTTEGIKEMGQYLSDKYVLKSEISSTIQRLSGESLIGEEVYDFWQKNIPIWMDYHGYDRNNGNIYTAYAPLHIYKPLANGTELRVYMWITPNIYVEWNLDINDNDDVHGIITVKE